MAVLAPISGLPRFKNGRLIPYPVAFFYDAGTTTPRSVFQNAAGTPHTQPVNVTGDNNFPSVYIIGTTAYRIRIFEGGSAPLAAGTPESGAGNLLADLDQLQGEVSTVAGGGGGTVIPTGFLMDSYDTGTVSGWVRANGRTIGSASSGATERANADTQALFEHLWNKDANLAVSGGRGATAAADWAANKTIALPDARFRARVGLDDMGNTAAGRSTGALFAFGGATTLGSYGGIAAHALTVSELPAHTHANTATTDTHAGHAHTTGFAGGHDHAIAGGSLVATTVAAQSGTGPAITAIGSLGTPTSGFVVDHTHAVSTAGAHAHVVTMANASVGSGAAHNTMPPFLLVTTYIKL